jgi:3-hydroxybutyrate dehydrogenase
VPGLAGRIVVVTGAGAGLGRAVALAFARAGARVTAVSIVADELVRLRSAAEALGLALDTAQADVGDAADTARLTGRLHAAHGGVDILVNNAGIIVVKPIEDTSVAEFDRVLATNLRGPFLYARACVAAMRRRGHGTILNVSSASGVRGFTGESAYCPSKFGLEGLTRTLALELDGTGVRVCSVSPGAPMRTPMSETTYDADARSRWIDPGEIAPGLLALAASDDDGISGGRFDAHRVARQGVAAGRDDAGITS